MPAPLLTGLHQVCLVVEDFEQSVRALAAHLGIGPWKCWDYRPPKILDTRRDGKPAAWSMKLGVAWVGDVQLEVIQPTGGATIYRHFLDTQGEGAHHLLVRTGPGYFEAIRAFTAAGYPAVQAARINPPMQVGGLALPALPGFLARSIALQFTYHDTAAALGTVLEISKMPPGISFELGVRLGKPDFSVPSGPGAPLVNGIRSVGILVPDLDQATRAWEAAGVGPWQALSLRSDFGAAAALPPVSVELVQPVGPGPYRTLFETHGPGIRTLAISGAPAATFAAAGFPILAETDAGVFIDARREAHMVFLLPHQP